MADRDGQLELQVTRHERRTETRRLMRRVRADADRIAAQFGLRYRALVPERPGVNEHYGVCYADGEIRIRIRHAVTGRPLRYSSLMDTVCHELAHLRHFDHGDEFQALFERMLDWAREQGIYAPQSPRGDDRRKAQPRPEPARAGIPDEVQLPLFGDARLRQALRRR